MPESIYIHIPFCKKICTYCDFCKMYYNEEMVDNYLNALEKEIDKYYQKEEIKTIYLGGGTPSCLTIKELEKLFSIIKKIKLAKNYEFTFECNTSDLNEDLLNYLKNNKVNRLSIGVQSFNSKYLKFMGRDITNIDKKINLAKKYFTNINIDLIYGFNEESLQELQDDLLKFLSLDVPHISTYALIVEENTMLSINNYQEENSDLQRKMYDLIRKTLEKAGYIHYELSNFCKKGYQSKHNLVYWNNKNYYGFGLGASGYIKNIRYTNTRSLNNYLKSFKREEEVLTKKEMMENEMILGLRKIKGISKNNFKKKYGVDIKDVFKTDNLKENKTYYYISKNKLFVSNSILIDFVDI